MRKLIISVYAIAKNEEKHVDRWANSCADADYRYILDTGSTDGTLDLIRKHLIGHSIEMFNPWRFDDARNTALARLPQNTDIAVVLDMDEVLCPGWREIVERAWLSKPDVTEIKHAYAFSPEHNFTVSRFHSLNYKWIKPVHEIQIHKDGKPISAYVPETLIIHKQDKTKSRSQYLELLAESVKQNPQDSRNRMYYARELTYYQRWKDAIQEFAIYLLLPDARWDIERAYAHRMLASCFSYTGQKEKMESALLRGCAEAPNCREAWYYLGEFYRQKNLFHLGYACALHGLAIVQKPSTYLDEHTVWTYGMHDLASVCAYYLGLKLDAISHAQSAVAAAPGDPRLLKNLELITAQH